MVRPVVRGIGTSQIDGVDVDPDGRFAPHDPAHFGLLIEATIGPADGPGEELFLFTACSPSWMVRETVRGGARWLRHFLLLERWDYDGVVNAVTKLCTGIDEADWSTAATKLGRYMHWEFEDYPSPP